MGEPTEHRCFTVSATSYLRNLDREDIKGHCVAVNYQSPPTQTERGRSIGLRYPMLVITHYFEQPDEVAEKVARILNEHWDDPEDAATETREEALVEGE